MATEARNGSPFSITLSCTLQDDGWCDFKGGVGDITRLHALLRWVDDHNIPVYSSASLKAVRWRQQQQRELIVTVPTGECHRINIELSRRSAAAHQQHTSANRWKG